MRHYKLVLSIFTLLVASLFIATPLFAAGIPQMIPYSGNIAVNVSGTPTPFNGTGQFKFAIVNAGCEDTDSTTVCTSLWSNDNSKTDGSEPTNYVTITVNSGSFAIKLGDISLKNVPSNTDMLPILDAVFATDKTYLRIWFRDEGTASTFDLLTPDRQLVSVPYAYRAETVTGTGVIGTNQISDVSWSKITGVPAGFADGTDNTGGPSSDLSCTGCVDSTDISNGTIADADISATAAIADSKLATISTAGKIAATALPSDGYASTYVNVGGDTMTGSLTVPSLTFSPSKTGYVAVQAYGFMPDNETTTWGGALPTNGFRAITGGTLTMAAPINFPEGVTLTELQATFFDFSATATVSVSLYRYNGDFSSDLLATVSTTAAEASGLLTKTNSALSHIASYGSTTLTPAYYLVWTQSEAGTSGGGPGLYAVRVQYTYTSP